MSEIEPVTERDIDEVLNARAAGYDIRYALEQDRRRVAERQAPEIERLRAEVASLRALVGTVRDTLGLRTINVADIDCEAHSREIGAKVARLSAACAQMRGALEQAPRLLEVGKAIQYYSDPKLHPLCEENFTFLDRARKAEVRIERAIDDALSPDAGRNMIDATGAVEATVQHIGANQGVPECFHVSATVPADWAGSRILIARVAK